MLKSDAGLGGNVPVSCLMSLNSETLTHLHFIVLKVKLMH